MKFDVMTPNYNSPRELRVFLDERGMGMRKRYGQNFLIHPGIRERLLDSLDIAAGENVWEIGPGLGAMTTGLLDRGAKVTAFEIDPGFSKTLKNLFGTNANFNLVEGDVLKTWPRESRETELSLLGNLPYNIAAVLLADFIEKNRFFKKMIITVQHETAQRIMAKPGTGDYSSLTVLCASVYRITPLMIIKGASFYPVPRVDSQGLRLDLREERIERPRYFGSLLRSLFSSRRKTIQNNLYGFVSSVMMKNGPLPEAIIAEALERSGISGGRRAETLEAADFAALARILEEIIERKN